MDTKELLVNTIKEWIKIDTEIGKLKKEITDKNKHKRKLTDELVTIMKTNQIDCFDIKDGGALVYKQNRIKKPINSKSLLQSLNAYYKNDSQIAEELTKFVMERREEQVKDVLKRTIK